MEGVKGYKIDLPKLHKWVVNHAICMGSIQRHRIPRVIKYKISLDGSNMGSRQCELVAITPMNLGLNTQSYHSVFPIMLYEGKETREALKEVLKGLNAQMDECRETHSIDGMDGVFMCDFYLAADYFALVKCMRPAKDELLPDATTAEGCSCAWCGEKRNNKTGEQENV